MLDNPNPIVHTAKRCCRNRVGQLNAEGIYDLIRDIRDPEHPYTLEELKVVSVEQIELNLSENVLNLSFTPTVPHCSLSTLIGLMIRVKLKSFLPNHMKVFIWLQMGSHDQEKDINKQLNDKERVAAAMENGNLMHMIQSKIETINAQPCCDNQH